MNASPPPSSTSSSSSTHSIPPPPSTPPDTYESHVSLISHLRSVGSLSPLRAARQAFAKQHPLSESDWQQWLSDENNLATTIPTRLSLLPLHALATQDFLSIPLFVAHLRLAISLHADNALETHAVTSIFSFAKSRGALQHPDADALISTYGPFCKRVNIDVPIADNRACATFEKRLENGDAMAYLSYVSYAETISDTCGVCAYERMVGKYFNWEVGWRAYVEFLVRRRRHMAREVAERGCRNLTEWGYGWGVRVRMAGEEKDDGENLKSLLKRAVFLPEVARAAWAACEEIGGDVREDVWKWWGLGRADLEEEKWALVAVLGAGVLVGGGCRKEGIEIMEGVVERWGGEARWWIGYARVLERGGGGGIREVFERGVAAVGVGEVAAVRGGWEMWEIGQGGGIGGRLEVVERVVGKREGERGGVWAPKRERAGARGGGEEEEATRGGGGGEEGDGEEGKGCGR